MCARVSTRHYFPYVVGFSLIFMCVLSVENRRRLYYQTFLVNLELDARNHELYSTIRSLRETQTRLVESEKLSALGRLIASLSHEIDNPINVLRNSRAARQVLWSDVGSSRRGSRGR